MFAVDGGIGGVMRRLLEWWVSWVGVLGFLETGWGGFGVGLNLENLVLARGTVD